MLATFVLILSVIAIGVWVFVSRGRRETPKAADAFTPETYVPTFPSPYTGPPVPAGGDAIDDLVQQAAQNIDPYGDAQIHARVLKDKPEFAALVDRLADPATPFERVRQLAFGIQWVAASAAFEALSRRTDRAEALKAVQVRLRTIAPGVMHYVLRYFTSLDPRPPVGAPFTVAEEWWVHNPNLMESYRDYLQARETLGDAPVFGDSLDQPGVAPFEAIRNLLQRQDHPFAANLLTELESWKARRVDEAWLNTFGRLWTLADFHQGFEAEPWIPLLDEAERALIGQPSQSVIAMGGARVGKSTFLKLLGKRLAGHDRRVFEATAAELMSGQSYYGEMEARITRMVAELDTGKKMIWSCGDILRLATSGTHQGQSASLLDQVMPAVTSGRLILLGEADPEGLSRLFQLRPSLRSQMQVVRLEAFDGADFDRFVKSAAERLAEEHLIDIDADVTAQAVQLANQFLGAADAPGVAVDALKRAVSLAPDQPRLTQAHLLDAVSQLTGLPISILDESLKVELSLVQAYFAGRVIGQDDAVATVVDRIAMLKAGLTDPARPVGVFLFAGPTGTGKTELAKTLAEFLFGSPDRMARLDMSEFQTPDSIIKILGERGGRAGDSLVEMVRQHPFSVVLLDEFEKAHSNVWDLFLQVFDDGRLTDADGRTVDFRHTIIILTSNLGATSHRSAGMGFTPSKDAFDDSQIEKAITERFRPEFVNRLDRIVVFKPLTRALMYRILRKELAAVLERRGLRNRAWAVEWEPSALDFLIDRGFSATMGARPLKRAIDQHLLAPLAHTLVEHRFPQGDQFLFVRSDGTALEVEFVDPDSVGAEAPDPTPAPAMPTPAAPASLAGLILQPVGDEPHRSALAAAYQALETELAGDAWASLKADLAAQVAQPDIWQNPNRAELFSRLELMDRIAEAMRTAEGLTRRLSYGKGEGLALAPTVQRLALQLHLIRAGVDDAVTAAPGDVLLAVETVLDSAAATSDDAEAWQARLMAMYTAWAEKRRMATMLPASPSAILRVTGFGAYRTLSREAGLHILEDQTAGAQKRTALRVRIAPGPTTEPKPRRLKAELEGLIGKSTQSATVIRRYCERPSPLVRDGRTGARSGRLDDVLAGDFDLILGDG